MSHEERILLDRTLADPTDAKLYISEQQGYAGLQKARTLEKKALADELYRSGLRGRGGAAFNLGQKLSAVGENQPVYMVVNLDEGEPGTFKDRVLCEQQPHKVLEGAAICAEAAHAAHIYIYCRREYAFLEEHLQAALASAYAAGVLEPGRFTIRLGAGAYICGEETALIESLEGKRGYPRHKPPYPTQQGLWQQPTVISNVETLANLPYILRRGAEAYARIGHSDYPGTKLISLVGDVNRPGCYEVPTDYLLRDVIFTLGGGIPGDKRILAVQVGGSAGAVIPPADLNIQMAQPAMKERGFTLGSGSVLVLDETKDILSLALSLIKFFEDESCGKCTPCREGTFRARRLIEKITYQEATLTDLDHLVSLLTVMGETSLCGLGQSVPVALQSLIYHFPDCFRDQVIKPVKGDAAVD
jgi:NADH-quinone oxidoreductase subunit F